MHEREATNEGGSSGAPDTFVLVERANAGDRAALDELFERHFDRVSRIVALRTGDALKSRTEVDDIVQDVFVRALRSLPSFEKRDDARFVHWLAKLAENEIRSRAAKYAARRSVPLEVLVPEKFGSTIGFDIARDTTAVPERVERKEIEALVDECLAQLSERHREVILLADYLADASWAFVGESMGLSAKAAEQLHRRARAKLSELVRLRL